jgi:membrane protease YdiL (CAAX protease family)
MPWDFWLILIVLVFVIPWRGHRRLKRLFAKPRVESAERLGLYASTIAFQWFATLVVGWRAWARGVTAGQLGLSWQGGINVFAVSIAGVMIFGLLHWLNLRRVGKLPVADRGPVQRLAERILPRSTSEFVLYLVLALTAGICEEFLYRGFVMAILARAGFAPCGMVLVSSIFFGLAHLYQGRSGFVSTLLVGVVFGLARIAYHTLEPVILWHAAVDIVAGFAGYRYLLRNADSAL